MLFDLVKLSVWACLGAFAIALFSAAIIVYQNSGSRNLVFALGTLGGAMMFFGVQLWFELRSDTVHLPYMTVRYTVDPAVPEIKDSVEHDSSSAFLRWLGDTDLRRTAESEASKWLASNNTAEFDVSGLEPVGPLWPIRRLATDLAVFSLVSFLETTEIDWQMLRFDFRDRRGGLSWQTFPMSRRLDCTIVTTKEITSLLSRSQNVFAGVPPFFTQGGVCLPPKTKVEISRNEMSISNPICKISFTVLPIKALPTTGVGLGTVPTLMKYGVDLAIEVSIYSFALRSNSRDAEKYKNWASKFAKDASDWFAPPPPLSETMK